MSSTADARRDAPARPALTRGEPEISYARARAPRPWTAALQRPAAKILVAGGLTLAGWLLGGALSGSTASAAERPACPEAPVVSTVDHAAKPLWHARHRKNHHESGESTCAVQPKTDSAEPPQADEPPADEPSTAAETTPETTKDSPAAEEPATTPSSATTEQPDVTSSESTSPEEPAATTKTTSTAGSTAEAPKATSSSGNLLGNLVGGTLTAVTGATTKDTTADSAPKATSSGGGLVGGLVGGLLDVVGGTLSTVTDTVGAVTGTLTHTVLAPLTQPPAGNPGAPVLLPLDDLLGPVFSGGFNSGGVVATVPGVTTAVVTQAPATVAVETVPAAVPTTAAADEQQVTRVAVVRLVVRHAEPLPAVHEQPRDSGTRATGGGGDTTPGLPGGTTAPSAPAPTAAPGHDGPGGARHTFAVHTDDVTTTQLKLIGTSRDHEVDGAGREAALPTTSPD
ncbi:hypothetical protein [Amycolatopsis plumensis]|uniref:Uncharacterized protein n=1 Tax=Amycolatopsis plumensis TaxID=236508 RepID=A0ABV5U950_9PSEU